METPEAKERYKIRSKTVERPFDTLKTKYALNRIQNNRTTRSKHRIKTIYNRTQLKKNIQRNKQKK